MEAAGIALDLEALAALEREFAAEITRLEARDLRGGRPPSSRSAARSSWARSCSSSSACRRAARRRPATRPTRRVLEELRGVHPVIEPVLDWRIYTKLRSTYVEALPTLIGPDGRLHTLFHQAVAATGRLSSSDPNLQNIPIRTPLGRRIRHAFVAGSPDTTLVAADYSQIELRILAHVSRRRRTCATRSRARPTSTARRPRACCARPPEDVTADERSMAKMVNFGLAYGMSDFGLSSRAGISRQDAQEFINSYFAAYGGISRYMHPHPRDGARSWATCPRCSGASGRSRSCGRRTARSRPPASGWRSTCRSRARPPTS